MAEVLIKEETLTAVADKIREKTGTNNSYKPKEMEEAVEDVYDAGKQAEYDTFWDSAQRNGDRINYSYAFAGEGWTDKNFKPKYNIVANPANGIFQACRITNMVKILADCGVTLDTSESTNNDYLFNGAQRITHIPTIDTTGDQLNRLSYMFNLCRNLMSVEKIILKSDGSQVFTSTFSECNSLVEVRFEGVIGNSISFSASPLSKDSIISIVNALSGTATGKTLTLKKSAVNTAFGIDVDDETTWGESTEFYILRHLKDNWTFSYV